eukprot:Pgem_evm1s11046
MRIARRTNHNNTSPSIARKRNNHLNTSPSIRIWNGEDFNSCADFGVFMSILSSSSASINENIDPSNVYVNKNSEHDNINHDNSLVQQPQHVQYNNTKNID